MPNYSALAKSALATIAKNGKTYQISRSSPIIDNITGQATPDPSPATGEIAAVILPRYKGIIFNNLDDSFKEALIRGELKTALCAAEGSPFKPRALDEIAIGAEVWQVVGNTELAPDGTPIIYTLGIILK